MRAARGLKDVHKISQKSWDIVFGYVGIVQSLFPTANCYFNIVDLIKHLILLYYDVFESNIVNEEEIEKLKNLLRLHNKELLVMNGN